MGDIFSGEIDMEMKRRFAASNVYGKEECRNCWAKFYCSGGCNANNHTYAGDIMHPYHLACELPALPRCHKAKHHQIPTYKHRPRHA